MTWSEVLPLWITLGMALAGFLYVRRYGGGAALDELQRANSILADRVHELERENVRLHADVARLQERTDVALAVQPVSRAIAEHERAAAARGEAMLRVLDMIARRMGADPEAL